MVAMGRLFLSCVWVLVEWGNPSVFHCSRNGDVRLVGVRFPPFICYVSRICNNRVACHVFQYSHRPLSRLRLEVTNASTSVASYPNNVSWAEIIFSLYNIARGEVVPLKGHCGRCLLLAWWEGRSLGC